MDWGKKTKEFVQVGKKWSGKLQGAEKRVVELTELRRHLCMYIHFIRQPLPSPISIPQRDNPYLFIFERVFLYILLEFKSL